MENALKEIFQGCETPEQIYLRLIEMGRELEPMSEEERSKALLVPGCQSQLFLYSELKEGRLHFKASSDALISAGLAAMMLHAYSGTTPDYILTTPPDFVKDLQLHKSLSPSRSNGLHSLHQMILKMAITALKS